MKQHLFIFSALTFICPLTFANNNNVSTEQCIAENSGAGSIDCLERVYWQKQYSIQKLEKSIFSQLKQKRQSNDLGETHYKMAVYSLKDASTKFAKFSERQCDFAVGASGAVASGSGQVRWSCLIQLEDWYIQYLQSVLLKQK